MHSAAFNYVKQTVDGLSFTRVLDIGGRNVNGTPKDLFPDAEYVALDIMDDDGVDIVADGGDWVSPEPFDCILCLETLEHTPRGADIVLRSFENLVPGGLLVVTTATTTRRPHSGTDGREVRENEYYGNVDEQDLRTWFESAGLSIVEIMVVEVAGPDPEIYHGGDLYGTAMKTMSND